ncbi:hypothetical protein HJG60_010272 [Phyllostomus discolor]|uniref:Uncharacterized protein n=1 Tax=Phyllostomus discolor TaxID=89673 RepID=A0A834AWF8_9CHIR|nr:hypothetical protein HJG60_010272 [Phyllostomus discolor]
MTGFQILYHWAQNSVRRTQCLTTLQLSSPSCCLPAQIPCEGKGLTAVPDPPSSKLRESRGEQKDCISALTRWLNCLQCYPMHQKVVGSIPSQGTCLGCWFDLLSPVRVCMGGNHSMFLSLMQTPAHGIHVLWMRQTNSHGLQKSCGENGWHGHSLSERGPRPSTWTSFYCFPAALQQRRFSFIILGFTLSDYFLQITRGKNVANARE